MTDNITSENEEMATNNQYSGQKRISDDTFSRRGALTALTGLGVLSLASSPASASSTHDHLGQTWSGSVSPGLEIEIDSGDAFVARTTSTDNNFDFGIVGRTNAQSGRGVAGFADNNSGNSIALLGRNQSENGVGIRALCDAETGSTNGIFGQVRSPNGRGIYATNTSDTGGPAYGCVAQSNSSAGTGLLGTAIANTGETYGVRGEVDSPDGYGLYTPDDAKFDGVVTTEEDWVVQVEDSNGVDAANVIQGHPTNGVEAGAVGGVIGGGGWDSGSSAESNEVLGNYGTISGGAANEVGVDDGDPESAEFGTVSGGEENTASGAYATVGGGATNGADGDFATISGGFFHLANEEYSTIGGGGFNVTDSAFGTIGGGSDNYVNGSVATVSGGVGNHASGEGGAIGGGGTNSATGNRATVAGGQNNVAGEYRATVGGGEGNEVTGQFGTIPGGRDNGADGDDSFAAGRGAHADHDGSFVVGDSSDVDIASNNSDEARFQHQRFFIGEGNLATGSQVPLTYDPDSGELLADTSSARYKTSVEPLSTEPQAVLDLEPRTYERAENGKAEVGLIAEEVAECVPELVITNETGSPEAVRYDRLGVYLLSEMQRQCDRIEELTEQNEMLAERLSELEARLDSRTMSTSD